MLRIVTIAIILVTLTSCGRTVERADTSEVQSEYPPVGLIKLCVSRPDFRNTKMCKEALNEHP